VIYEIKEDGKGLVSWVDVDVADALRELDPVGADMRKKRRVKRMIYYFAGPNQSWCFDGHDKMNKYGLPITGCRCV
jgi:hypothetical protein